MNIDVLKVPFPHVIITDTYEEEELEAIWDELKFFTRPGKLLTPDEYRAAPNKTKASAIILDHVFSDTKFSNIMSLESKILNSDALHRLGKVHESCEYFSRPGHILTTKLRYYHHGESYVPHADYEYLFLIFSYFNKTPKKYEGGELIFPDHDYSFSCDNNTSIIIPAYIAHGVNEVSIKDSDYYDGYGRYCVSVFAKT
tara:strand:- start:179 stop:775 length:597 start_codon:yes stop_codon:yes gene_type:complete